MATKKKKIKNAIKKTRTVSVKSDTKPKTQKKKPEKKALLKKVKPAKKAVTVKPAAKTATAKGKTAIKGAGKKTAEKKKNKINFHETLKRKLIQARENIVKEAKTEIAKYIKGESRQYVESGMDDGDWSVIDLSEDINFKRLAAHRESLLTIDEALRKLGEGTYGICEDCGEAIIVERLKVMPFAIYCRDCQEKREELEKITEEL